MKLIKWIIFFVPVNLYLSFITSCYDCQPFAQTNMDLIMKIKLCCTFLNSRLTFKLLLYSVIQIQNYDSCLFQKNMLDKNIIYYSVQKLMTIFFVQAFIFAFQNVSHAKISFGNRSFEPSKLRSNNFNSDLSLHIFPLFIEDMWEYILSTIKKIF